MELVVFIGVGQVAIVLVYRILDALQPQPVELGIFFIGNEPTIRRKGVSIGGVYHLDHNKTLILADGHLNEPALRVGDLLAGVKAFSTWFPRTAHRSMGAICERLEESSTLYWKSIWGAGCLCAEQLITASMMSFPQLHIRTSR